MHVFRGPDTEVMSYPSRQFDSITSFALISDTHGLLREQALEALKSYKLILHAGDVGPRSVLKRLETIASVVAVRGNTDCELFCLPPTELLSVNGRLVYMLHDLHMLDLDPAAAGISMVVSGHSHQPSITACKEVLYVNPGSIGPKRFNLPISFAKVDCGQSGFGVELVYFA
ncbi:MAG TPA: metallophosphoesterase family protein [Chthoniobacterales bacterium]|nr:metallophosphoesterase family protein [Chthoniobacterales bacterium]